MSDSPDVRNIERARAAKTAKKRLEHDSQITETVLESTNEGFVVWDSKQKLVAWSKKCPDFWYEPENILRPGMPMVELLRHIATKGGFGIGDTDKLAQRELRRIRKAGTDSEDEFQMHDGRVIHVQRNSMPDGGHASTYTDITERRRAEAALQESEERLRHIVDTSPFGVSIVSRANRQRLYVNHRFVEMLGGRSDEEILKWPAVESYSDPSKREQNWAAFERDGILPSTEEQRKRLDGTTWWCLTDWRPIAFEGKEAVMNWHYDITKRKQAEEARRESEDLLDSIIENVPVGLLIKDPDHIVERANDTYLKWYGFDADTMVDRRSDEIEDFQSAEEAEFMNAQEREVLTTGLTQARQVDRLFADGQIHTIAITKFPVYDQRGKITKVGSVSIDLTDQVQAQKALAHSEERLKLSLKTGQIGTFFWNIEDDTHFWDDRMHEIWGLEPGTYQGTMAADFLASLHPDDLERVKEAVARTLEDDTAYDIEYMIIRPDKSVRHVHALATVIRDDQGQSSRFIGVCLDITERKRMEEALVDSEERHRHFSADVAHELRTPLAVLRSHLDNLENTETNQSLINDVDVMSRLVSQLLATTQLDSLTVNPNDEADLHAIGTEIAKNLAPFAIKEGRSIEMTGTQDPVMVRGNDDALEMAVRNLVENAIRYSARETVVTIHVSDNPAISVINHGLSIPPEQKKVIFQRFKRADRRGGGAGLGLSIVQRVVETHQATIEVSDVFGGGAVFKISFPSHKSRKVVAV